MCVPWNAIGVFLEQYVNDVLGLGVRFEFIPLFTEQE